MRSAKCIKWIAMAIGISLVIGVCAWHFINERENTAVLPLDSGVFSSEISQEVMEQFEGDGELKKVYFLLDNDWFLSDRLQSFQQVVTQEIMYVATEENGSYTGYRVDEAGTLQSWGDATPPNWAFKPYGLSWLTYDVIEGGLEDVPHDDYIITYSRMLNTVFIWIRGKEEWIVTYPTRPDLLGLEVGKAYTLKEVQEILTKAHE